ncbi:MAG: hypothetical protein HY235_06605 [Acidobacteria bacterium]|nr:hypothetical protein [Acidobacteriota bacterium]
MKRLVLVLLVFAPALAQQREMLVDFADISLPSEAAGGGNLALRLLYFGSARTLLDEGAPVVIEVPGGFQPGGLQPLVDSGFSGFVYVRFLFPGGRSENRSSDGTYDTRGLNSILALRDVILYASGDKTDVNGKRITDMLPFRVLTGNVGLLGGSFGGNACTAVIALHGAELPRLQYFVGWENPTNAQISVAEPGPGATVACPGGAPPPQSIESVNPYFRAYHPIALEFDYSKLAFDAATNRLFFDGNANGRIDQITLSNGCTTTDVNRNGRIDAGEDFPINPITAAGDPRRYYSPSMLEAAAALKIDLPNTLATAEQAERFWAEREAVRFYDRIPAQAPGIEVMLLASAQDHVQTAPGHLHIRQAFEGFLNNGTWVRINPSPEAAAGVSPALSLRSDLPRMEPNTPPQDWNNAASFTYPEGIPDRLMQAAAAREMATRAAARSAATSALQ